MIRVFLVWVCGVLGIWGEGVLSVVGMGCVEGRERYLVAARVSEVPT